MNISEKIDFSTYLGAKGTVYMMGVVEDSKGSYIILYSEQYKEKVESEFMEIDKYGAKTHLIKISNDGKKIEGRYVYESLNSIQIPMNIEIDDNDDIYITGMSVMLPFMQSMKDIKTIVTNLILGIKKREVSINNLPFKLIQGYALKIKCNELNNQSQDKISNKEQKKIKMEKTFYFGGNGITLSLALVDDKKGHIWLTGLTNSENFEIRSTNSKVYQPKLAGNFDGFICKLNKQNLTLEFSTYVGGELKDVAQSICTDSEGNIYVTGIADIFEDLGTPWKNKEEEKKKGKFKVTEDVFQKGFGGGISDGFIIKLDNNGECKYCSYIGGEDNDEGTSVAADKDGNAYILGNTGPKFPIVGNSLQKELTTKNKGIFIAKISADGKILTDSTYFGGSYDDTPAVIKAFGDELYIYGVTASKDFPMVSKTYTPVYFGDSDAFFSIITNDFRDIKFSSYVGGTKRESGRSMLILSDGSFILLGDTVSKDFPITKGALNENYDNVRGEGYLFRYTPKSFDIEVDFPDENLKDAIRGILNKKSEEKITQYDLMKINRYVDLSSKGIENLEGIQYCKYILGLDLKDNKIEDITSLIGLQYVNFLDLRQNRIKDVTPLEKLINLSYLYLSNNQIEDISPLNTLKLISELKLENNNVQIIDIISKMSRIRVLESDSNKISDLSPLRENKNLSKVSATAQVITKTLLKKSSDKVLLTLDFLSNIDSQLPNITDISNEGILDLSAKTITWLGITTDTTVTFKFNWIDVDKVLVNFSGEVKLEVQNSYSLGGGLDSQIDEFSTFIGSEDYCMISGLVCDNKGNSFILYNHCYLQKDKYSSFPIAKGFVIKKISSDGTTVLAKKMYHHEMKVGIGANSITIDKDNNIYVVGQTTWDEIKTTAGAIKPKINQLGKSDCFIMKFSGDNFTDDCEPLCATYFGAAGKDSAQCIVVDDDGSIWIGGKTTSKDFPVTEDACITNFTGYVKLFVAKLNSTFSKIEYATLLGGDAIDAIYGMDIDGDGNVYVTGTADYLVAPEYRYDDYVDYTEILNYLPNYLKELLKDFKGFKFVQGNWKPLINAYQREFGGGESDAFLAKFKRNGEVCYITFLGGAKMDLGTSVTVDEAGCPYVIGYTKGDFIVNENSYMKIADALEMGMYIIKLSSDGKEVLASTYFGGSYQNSATNIKVHEGKVYLVGTTNSLDFPITEGAKNTIFKVGTHGFLAILDLDLKELKYSTFIGGSLTDVVNCIVIDKDGAIIIAGGTDSKDFPITENAFKKDIGSKKPEQTVSVDGFLMKLIIK